jgi:acetylornithine/succinyldiaminopimelate/putrescine aminotransferase
MALAGERDVAVRASNEKFLGRDTEPEDFVVSRAEGSFVFDDRGRRYIDFIMGWCVGNLGWNNPTLNKAVRSARAPTYIYSYYSYKGWSQLAELLARIAPGNLRRSFRATGGSEAVEIAMQLAIAHTGRTKFLSLEDSYHGNTFGALSVGASAHREKLKTLLPNCHKIKLPLDDRALGTIETHLKKRDVAAFIMEAISMNLGVYVPDADAMTRLQRLCRKYGTLLVIDEVARGFGRTGKMFACEHYGLEPDIMTLGKAISGGHAPLGATMATDKVAKSATEAILAYSTFGWHPLSVAAAIANVRLFIRNGKAILANAAEISDLFKERLASMEFKRGTKVRVKGLAIAIEFDTPAAAERLVSRAQKNGLLITADEKIVQIFPALNIDRLTAEEGLDRLAASLTSSRSLRYHVHRDVHEVSRD